MRANLVAIVCCFLFVLGCGRTVPNEARIGQEACETGSNCGCGDCDDGDACTEDKCVDGACSSEYKDCDDNNACTYDSCSSSGSCQHEQMECGCDYRCRDGLCVADSDGEPDRCNSGGPLVPPCTVIDAQNNAISSLYGKTFIDIDRFNVVCYSHYEKQYQRKSVTENVGTVADTTISGIKLAAGYENKPLLKKCAEQCELRGWQMVKNLNVKNVVDCTGKSLSAASAVFNVMTTLSDINDDSCLVQTQYNHPKMKVSAGPPCPTDCRESTTHECSECGAEEPDLRRTSLKTLDIQQAGIFRYDVMSKAPCNADHVAASNCPNASGGGWCMRSSCGSGPAKYEWISNTECWNILCAYEAARRHSCDRYAETVCDGVRPPEPKLTCADFGAQCGTIVNDEGTTLNCGSCPSGKRCEANKCVKVCPAPPQATAGGICNPSDVGNSACGAGVTPGTTAVLDCRWWGGNYSWQPSEVCRNGEVCTSYSFPGSNSCFTGCK